MSNLEIRNAAKASKVTFWMIADHLGIAESTFTRMMRHELPDEKKKMILAVIDQLHKEV